MSEMTPDQFFGTGPKEMSPEEFFGNTKPQAKGKSAGDDLSTRLKAAGGDLKDFLVKAAKEYNDAEQAGEHHPVDYTLGTAKGMLGGLIDLGGQAVEGITGLAKAGGALLNHESPTKSFNAGMATGKRLMDKLQPYLQKHFEEHGKTQEAAQSALGIIPQAIQAAGDASFDATHSPFVGAATQAVSTLASILGGKAPLDAVKGILDKPKPAEVIRSPAAKPRARVVDGNLVAAPTPSKPRMRMVDGKLVPAKTPEELGAEARTNVAQARADLVDTHPEVRQQAAAKAGKAVTKSADELLADFENSTKHGVAGHTAEVAADVRHANVAMAPYIRKFVREGLTTSHTILDHIIRTSEQGGWVNELAKHLKEHVDNLPVVFKNMLENEFGHVQPDWKGSYDRLTHSIEIRNEQEDHIHSILHELVHAATSKFIHDDPEHPLVKELEVLYQHSKKEWEALQRKHPEQLKDKGYYGLKDLHEFVAEAMSNRKFQHFLANIKSIPMGTEGMVSRTALNGWSRFKGVVRRMLGLKNSQGALVDHVLSNATQLMKEQKGRKEMHEQGIVYGNGTVGPTAFLKHSMGDVVGMRDSLDKMIEREDARSDELLQRYKSLRGTAEANKVWKLYQASQERARQLWFQANKMHAAEGHTKHAAMSGDDDPILFQHEGVPVRRRLVTAAFRIGTQAADRLPGFRAFQSKMTDYYGQIQRTFHPEGLGIAAKQTAAILSRNLSIQMRKDTQNWHMAKVRRAFWQHRPEDVQNFIFNFEKGGTFSDPILNRAAEAYRAWNREIFDRDQKLGIDYEPMDNYLYHVFQDGPAVQDFFNHRYGKRWGDPRFMKDRQFDFYEEAIKAGFKPKYTNPEDIMLARQHASDIAEMRVNTIKDLESAGLAVKKTKDMPIRPQDLKWTKTWRAPGGDTYYIHDHAWAILHNAFETKGLWDRPDMFGDAFRGAMWLKNITVPIKFGLSLFHPLHILTLDNAAAMTRMTESLLSGVKSPEVWLKDMAKSQLYLDTIQNSRTGGRLMKLFRGQVPAQELTDADRQAIEFMADGGFVPEISEQYRTNARKNFMDALQAGSAKAIFKAPFALLSLAQKPLFEVWIPNLKAASYLQDCLEAVKADSSLLDNPLKRQMRFRQIAKSVDNRYGEMAYSTLFWNKMAKDLAVGNMLSLGWNYGFLREYGGGVGDLARTLEQVNKAGVKEGVKSAAQKGLLHKSLFVSFYTAQTMLYGGLLTYAFTGQSPQHLIDFIYPRIGTNPDGSAKRVSTMFYAREFYDIMKHIQNQGTIAGLTHLMLSKSSGVVGLVSEGFTGVNSLGQEISNPNDPALKQLEERVAGVFKEMKPVWMEVLGKGKETVELSMAGFNPAPKYVTDSPAVSFIKTTFDKYYQGRETPYLQAERSEDMKKLRDAYHAGNSSKQQELLTGMKKKYSLTGDEMTKLEQKLSEPAEAGIVNMFKRLSWQQQKKALDKMTPKERELFLPHANIEHLRYTYRPPSGDNE